MTPINSTTKKLLLLVFIGLIAAMLLLLNQQTIDLASVQVLVGDINQWRTQNSWLFVGLFFALVTATSLPVALWFTLAAGALFSIWWSTLLVSFASSIGANLAAAPKQLMRDWPKMGLFTCSACA